MEITILVAVTGREEQALLQVLWEEEVCSSLCIQKAPDGSAVVEQYRKYRPDLVILQAELPGQTGMEAATQIRRISPEAELLLLAGKGDLWEAQQAVSLRAAAYLTAPYSIGELRKVIYAVKSRYEKRRLRAESEVERRRLQQETERYFKRDILQYAVSEKELEDEALVFLERYFRMAEEGVRCVVFSQEEELSDTARNDAQQALEKQLQPLACLRQDACLVCLLRPSDGWQRVEWQGRKAAGAPVTKIRLLPQEYRRLIEKTVHGTTQNPARSQAVLDLYELESQLCRAVLQQNFKDTARILNRLSTAADAINGGDMVKTRAYFSYLWRQADRAVYRATGFRRTTEEKLSIDRALETVSGADALAETTLEFLRRYVGLLQMDKGSGGKTVRRAKEYVEANLSGDLSLERVSDEMGFSSYYFSRLFKREEGVSYKEYVITTRIERAKDLLATGNRSIAQVAGQVGYANAGYFSKTFREYTGISAGDFGKNS